MNRSLKFKLLYFAAIASALVGVVAGAVYWDIKSAELLVLALLFMVPGRIGNYFLRDLFRSRHLVEKQEHDEAIVASERFLHALDHQPWRQYFMYCFFGVYTWSTRAMALNNLGSAKMELGRIDEAEIHFGQAIKTDGAYPIPYYNLAIIAAVRNDNEQSKSLYSKAEKLGFSKSGLDQAITRVAAVYARIQSLSI